MTRDVCGALVSFIGAPCAGAETKEEDAVTTMAPEDDIKCRPQMVSLAGDWRVKITAPGNCTCQRQSAQV